MKRWGFLLAWLVLFPSCTPPVAPEAPQSVLTRVEVRAAPGYQVVLQGKGPLVLPYRIEAPGEVVLELEATPEPTLAEPVWIVTFPETHEMTYPRRTLSVRVAKNTVSLWVGPGR